MSARDTSRSGLETGRDTSRMSFSGMPMGILKSSLGNIPLDPGDSRMEFKSRAQAAEYYAKMEADAIDRAAARLR